MCLLRYCSLQVAEELMKKTKSDEEEAEPAGFEGMEAFARAIEIGTFTSY